MKTTKISISALGILAAVASQIAPGQVTGRNINMVSGTTWPGGDPFLQRQNEPSIAVSTRNPQHLLAGANDYRTVDLASVLGSEENGDAWLGVFKSFDGGETWTSTLLPGCPYGVVECSGAPSLTSYQAASDPAVRAGTNGMFYYSGITFNRDRSASLVFVARYIDNNNKENGDPIAYIATSVVSHASTGTFVDKPSLAVDIPRSGALTCNINGQSFFGGNVYIAYTSFEGKTENLASIQFSRSGDCGATWSVPVQITDYAESSQGTAIAVDPVTGAVYVAWRRFSDDAGAIVVSKSTDRGVTFQPPVVVSAITAFDQDTSATCFRTSAYPSITVDSTSRVYVAWSSRTGPGADARVVISSSSDGTSWTTPQLVDASPARGHQWMPALTFTGGKLTVVYYDARNDHYIGLLQCPAGKTCSSTADYQEVLQPVGDSLAAAFNSSICDTSDLVRRHTIDVRVAQSAPGPFLSFSPSVQVSEYLFGSSSATTGSKPITQLRFNVPDVPLFAGGTEPFIGDYLDVTASPTFIPVVTGTRTVWRYNFGVSTGSIVHAAWTDNRDVIPPPDDDWTKYTPPKVAGPSVFDSTQTTPVCSSDRTGMRNQNIYTARISAGVVAGSPGNNKPLSQFIERGFVVFVQNPSDVVKSYRLSIAPGQQPPGGQASFLSSNTSPLTPQLDVSVAPHSSISRTVFVTSSDVHAHVAVTINEITAPGGTLVSGPGTQSSVQLNPDLTNPDLTNPDLTNPNQSNIDPTTAEVYNPDLTNPDLTNPDLTNPDLTNPDLTNPDLTNPDLTNPDLTNNRIPSPDLTNPDLTNPDLTNADIVTPDLTNGSISDTVWTIQNLGNTAAAYSVKLLLKGKVPDGIALQLLLYKVYTTPAAKDCQVVEKPNNILIANIPNPVFAGRPDLTNPDLTNPDLTNPTLALAPGETAQIALRTASPSKTITFNPVTSVTALAVAHSANTGTTNPPVAASRLTIISAQLSDGIKGDFYADTLRSAGHVTAPVAWAVPPGTLPPGLSVNPSTGVISGTPTSLGTFNFPVTIADSAVPPNTDTTTVTIRIAAVLQITTVSPLPAGKVGTPYSQALAATGGNAPYSWAVKSGSLPAGLSLNAATGVISGAPTISGVSVFQIQATDSSSPAQTAVKFPITIRINP